MAPKFSKPHLIKQETQTVSRADLDAEHDVPATISEFGDVLEHDIQALEGLLKRSFGELQLDVDPPKVEARKYKKAKLEPKEEPELEEAVSFRLFSNAPPKAVSLKPKPPPEVKVSERAYEDNDAEASQRAERAKAVAVDSDWILKQSRAPTYPSRLTSDKKLIHVTLDSPLDSAPELMLAEVKRPLHSTPQSSLAHLKLPVKEKPNPHDIPSDKIFCPVVSAQKEDDSNSALKKKKRRGRNNVQRQPPSFFRPLQEWAGKSRGYAMGYEGSRPVPIGSTRQWEYRRDTMRSGVMSQW